MEGIIQGATAVVAGVLGVVVGLVAALAFRFSDRNQRRDADAGTSELDGGLVRVLSVLRSAAVVIGDDDEVIRASPPAYALGIVRNDALVHPAIVDMVHGVRRDGVIREEELELPRGPIGSGTVLLQVRVAALGLDNLLVLAEDRTEARRVEAIRRDFVVNVSHELKTPVGALALLAETVQDAADDPVAVRRFTERMQSEAHRLSALVHEIIELSRLQVAGALQKVRPVPVRDVVDEAVDRARTTAQGKNITITVGGSADCVVFGDHNLLVTAVRNLLDNAVSYSGENTRVGVGVHERGGLVEIDVVDQGIGISAEVQERVFERFYRVDPARSRDTGGTGLGLSIVKHVAADHGGDVRVWSEPGKGSTFTLRIPAADLPAGELTTGSSGSPDDETDGVTHDSHASPRAGRGGDHEHGPEGPTNEEVGA
ncbi:two-component system sensor histidine kinase SenX3 [Isoptericola sp. CG 20/1183]|uniref:Sensor-like histidine kinase SenX3 n=1 Tax=Isoptericola halotolerans TaxID=300560 RepID=A0ABX5EHM9_9MICO|nr:MULTISPECIES: ATP-binding protein [Isoptericola]PRZ08172.1 two-component system sensor histidine kinase SenX3 [Isoptericola halotolerans]PRZ08969.1 two-component system sensor histidine kinase SenX3 [Isoptericola sp. CG 20/1183]